MIAAGLPDATDTARLAADALLDAGAVHFDAEHPFTLASGRQAPTYVDCRQVIGFVRLRALMMDLMAAAVIRAAGAEAFDVIAGGETAGIPFAALLAERLALPMAYIRKKPKGYGRDARIEGRIEDGQRVLLVEDLMTDGGSKLSFVEAIRSAGGDCAHLAVLFAYGLFPRAEARLDAAGVQVHALCRWADVLAAARRRDSFEARTLDEVARYLDDPEGWRPPAG